MADRVARLRWDILGVAGSASWADVDLLHMTRFAAPWAAKSPLVVTVHDLIPLQIPEYRASAHGRLVSKLARRTVVHAARVIVPTLYVANEVELLLGIDSACIDVIPMGVAISLESPGSASIRGPYVIHAGGFDARKNLPALLAAFAQAAEELGPDWRLVLVGAPHTANPIVYPPIRPIIEALGLEGRVILTGRVTEVEKQALYWHATIAAAPSLNEGFGLPILEAMAHGVPVVASNRTSHPEVAGDAALLVDPTKEAIAEALVSLGSDVSLRAEYSTRTNARSRIPLEPHSRSHCS